MKDVLSHPLFTQSVARAKAAAKAAGALELNPWWLLVGFHMLLSESAPDPASSLASKASAIAAAVVGCALPAQPDLAAAAAIKMPVDAELRAILATRNASLDELIDALLAAAPARAPRQPDPLFDAVLARAGAAAVAIGEQNVSAELFALAAWAAYLDGDFRDRPGLSVHMAANARNLEALLQSRGLQCSLFTAATAAAAKLADDLETELAQSDEVPALLLALNLGATVGARILEQRVTAVHEAGHAVVSFLLRPQVPVAQVSIVAADDYRGVTRIDASAPYLNTSDSRAYFFEDTCISLAGAIAQQIAHGADSMDSGAISDFSRATERAWIWVAKLGLDAEFGPLCLDALTDISGARSGWLFDRAQQRVQDILKDCAARTRALLEENWHHVQAVADALVERKVLDTDELMTLLLDKGLAHWPGVRQVRSLPEQREVRFAEAAGVQATLEGPVRYTAGDAIVTGAGGELWPIARVVFDQAYEPVSPGSAGENGLYLKRPRQALALQLRESRNVVLSGTRGVLSGAAGDWIVDYGNGDLAVVAGDRFTVYYEFL
jgi:hypothetical protein